MGSFESEASSFLQRLRNGENVLSAAQDMEENAIAQVLAELVAMGAVVGVETF